MTDAPQWDQLRVFEAVARLGSFTAAAKVLGVSQATVSRHVSKLEEGGSPLLLRDSPLRLTTRGHQLLRAVQPMVDAALAARAALEDAPDVRGLVTLTTVEEVLRWVLVHELTTLCRAHPDVRLRILADSRIDSLAAGEADLALRLFRPERGDLVGQKLRTEPYGYYAAEALKLHAEVAWLGLAGALAQLPDQRHAARAFASRDPRLLVEDVESLGLLVQHGLGVAVLPERLASRLGLRSVEAAEVGATLAEPVPSKELWLVVHRSRQHLPKVRAVIDWLQACVLSA